jgi:hypothetical protein
MDYYFEKKYSINGNNIYRRNGEFISRIVQLYRCSKCDHLSQNIVESDVHFHKFHPKNNQIISEKNNIKNNKISLYNNQNNNNNNNKDLKTVDKNAVKLNEKKGPKVVDYGFKESKFINKELNEIINKNFNEIIDRSVDKAVEKINIETGFKDFAEINCVSKLKTYSRKKLPENECEIIEEKVVNNNNSNEESVKNTERILRPGLNSCEICGEIYSKSYLSIHMNIHLDPKLCDYPFCEEKFASESQLKQHQQMHVINDNKRPKERKDRVIKGFKSYSFVLILVNRV